MCPSGSRDGSGEHDQSEIAERLSLGAATVKDRLFRISDILTLFQTLCAARVSRRGNAQWRKTQKWDSPKVTTSFIAYTSGRQIDLYVSMDLRSLQCFRCRA
jgi:hypothetical protein